MPIIKIHSEQELQEKFSALAHAVHNMRFAQKYWHLHFGYTAKQRREYWEIKVDGILNSLGLVEHQNVKAVKISPSRGGVSEADGGGQS